MAVTDTNPADGVREAIRRNGESQSRREERDTRGADSRQREQDESAETSSRRDGRRETANKQKYASLSQIGRMNQTPLAMSGTAQALETFRSDFVAAMPAKEDNNLLTVAVTPIDAATAGIPFSVLVVSGQRRDRPQLGVGYHVFLIAGSADPLRTREESYRGNRIYINNVPGDGYDDETRTVVREVLGRQYPGLNLFSGYAESIAADFPTAKDEPTAIADCVKNAFAAIKNAIDRKDADAVELSLAAADDNMHNSIHVQHRQHHVYDRGHQPVRADVIIDLISRPNKGRNSRDTIDQLITGTRISRLGGYWDLVYAPSDEASNRHDLFRRDRDDRRAARSEYQLYARRFVTTFIDTVDFSLNTLLLAQVTMNAAAEHQEFLRAFEPNGALGEDDLRNIGALAIEPNLDNDDRGFSDRYPTKTETFTVAKRTALLNTVIRPGTIWSIDIPECGASSWQYIDLLAAAEGNPAALERIYDAADVLTDGWIQEYFKRGDKIFDDHSERIHGGWYTEGPGGERLDLRDLDYLALLNVSRPSQASDLLSIQKWGMAASSQDDDQLSQSDRYETIRAVFPNAVFTQFFNRFNYLDKWNRAMVDAVLKCDLSLTPSTHGRDVQERYRGTYGNLDNLLGDSGSSGLFRNARRGRGRDRDRDDRDYDRDRDYRGRTRNDDRYDDR